MNIGIEDAYVLTKLMGQGRQGEYTAMRKPVIEKVVGRIQKLTDNFIDAKNTGGRQYIRYIAPVGKLLFGRQMNEFILGLDHEIGI